MKPYEEKYVEKPVGFFKRVLAFLLDLFILQFILVLPFQNVLLRESSMLQFGAVISSQTAFVISYLSFAALVYFALMEFAVGRTLGMMVLKIYTSGELTLLKSLVRHMYFVPFFPFTIMLFADPFWLVMKGERLSERWTKTQTVEVIKIM